MATEKKTRNVPQLSKDVRRLNTLKKRREKVTELDAQIADLSARIGAQLGFGPADAPSMWIDEEAKSAE